MAKTKTKKTVNPEVKIANVDDLKSWRREMKEKRKQKKLEIRAEGNKHKKKQETPEVQPAEQPNVPTSGTESKKTKKKRRGPEDSELEAPVETQKASKHKHVEESEARIATKEASFSDPETYKVVVAGIPLHVNEERLRRDFKECGEVLNVRLLKNRDTGSSRGIAFISFASQAGLHSALAYDGDDYGGRALSVQVAKKSDVNGGKGKGKGKTSPGDKPEGCTSVIVKGLSYSVTEADLNETFASCGDGPQHINMLMDKATGSFRGIAFVDFDSEVAVDEAIKLHGTELKGRRFSMDFAPPREKSSGPGQKPIGCTSIVVKGLAFTVTEADLTKVFESCGSGPSNIRIAIDKETGQPRGIAFIDFSSGDAVDEAIRLHGTELKGRPFKVDYAGASKDAQAATVKTDGTQKKLGKKPPGCTSVVVKGLTDAVTEKYLMKKFEACGSGPRNVNIAVDKETGATSSMAFVNFSEEAAVDEAIKLNGTEMKGQTVSVGYVKPKKR